jgi:ATP-dependent DNA ligase
MHATQVATPFHRPGWVYEEKVDGYRMVAYKDGASVRLISRQGKEFTQRFPELAKAVATLGTESVVLDTELAVFDRQLTSRFEWLRGQPKDDVATPPMLMAFDLLELDGEDQRKRPLRERRQALKHLLKGERLILPVRRLSPTGLEAWKEYCERAMKGSWRRIRRRPTWAAARSPGSRSSSPTTARASAGGRRRASPSPPSQPDVSSTRWPPCHSGRCSHRGVP